VFHSCDFLNVVVSLWFGFHFLLRPKDTGKRDEASSLHVMIDVMIDWSGENKNTDRGVSPAGTVD